MVFEYQGPDGKPLKGVAPALRIDSERPGVRNPPPTLGEHSVDALRIAGYSAEQIESLVRDHIVRVG